MSKNIHIIPTGNNKSKLAIYHNDGSKNIKVGELGLQINNTAGWTNCWSERELYITNDEEIKEGDWCIDDRNTLNKIINVSTNGYIMFENGNSVKNSNCKKIILTTDQDLFKDGVQVIDDNFLQWFMKNQSREKVEVKSCKLHFGSTLYKIIIPKEEPKQETLEEAAYKDFNKNVSKPYCCEISQNDVENSFVRGAKWQQERSCSKEEVLNILNQLDLSFNIEKWFEQFKKK